MLLLTVQQPQEVQGESPEGRAETQTVNVTVNLFELDDFWPIDDAEAAEAMQDVEDIFWDRSRCDSRWDENVLNKGIVGHQPMLRTWNLRELVPESFNVHPRNMWIDGTSGGDIEDAEFLGYDQPMSISEIKADFPHLAKFVEDNKDRLGLTTLGGSTDGNDLGAPFSQTTFHRTMVLLTTVWKRNEPWPLEPDEALQSGAIQQVTESVPMLNELGESVLDQDGVPAVVEEPVPGAFALPDGTETSPTAENWPHKLVIRQTQVLGDRIVDDRPNPYVDIPTCWNINLPIPFRPYGQGDPERCEDLQQAINRVLSNLHDHLRYFAGPQQTMVSSLAKSLGGKTAQLHSSPGKTTVIDDHIMAQFGEQALMVKDPPPLQRTYVDFFKVLLEEHDRIMGMSSVIQGFTDPNAESGKAIQALQAAARGPVGFKSHFTERAMKHMVKLDIGMIKDFLPESEWVKMLTGKPVQVLLALRARAVSLKYDIAVEIVSGRAAGKEVDRQNALEEYQLGIETTKGVLERLDRPDAKQTADQLDQQAVQAAQQEQ